MKRFSRWFADAKRRTLIESLPALPPSPGQPGDCGKRERGLLPLRAVEWFACRAYANEWLCNVRRREEAVAMRLPEGVALGLVCTVGTDGVEIERSEGNALTLPSFHDECVPPLGLPPMHGKADRIVCHRMSRSWPRIIGHGHGDQVLVGTHPELGQMQWVEVAGIRDEDEFSSFEHEDAGALRETAVVTDHRPDLERSLRGVEGAHVKVVARCQGACHTRPLAQVDFGVGQHDLPMPVEKRDRIACCPVPLLQIGEGDRHPELPGQIPEVEDERVITPDGLIRPEVLRLWLHHVGVCLLAWPQLWRAPEFIGSLPRVGGGITDVPELGEEGDISAHSLCAATEQFAFGFVGVLVIAARGQLKQGNRKLIHRWFSLRLVHATSLARELGHRPFPSLAPGEALCFFARCLCWMGRTSVFASWLFLLLAETVSTDLSGNRSKGALRVNFARGNVKEGKREALIFRMHVLC